MATHGVFKMYFKNAKFITQQQRGRVNYMRPNRNLLHLQKRGVIQNVFPDTRTEELRQLLESDAQCLYCGFDPTAASLHVGNLLALMGLLHGRRAGHNTIALIGGATCQIGDPSGKGTERAQLSLDVVQKNKASIESSLQRIFMNFEEHFCKKLNKTPPATLVLDNAEWYSDRNIIEFLSTVGRCFRMGTLLSRDSVKSRLASKEGMSLTEFTYQVFQSYDWLHLLKYNDCRIQIGGSDQTGNMSSGYDLITRVANTSVFGLLVPLVKSTSGDKLGKTAGNAVWLNPDKTSPFEFYQYFLRTHDVDVEQYLKLFTFVCEKEITDVMRSQKLSPESRSAQKLLAEQTTLLVHGVNGVVIARRCSEALYGSSLEALVGLSQDELSQLFQGVSSCELPYNPATSLLDAVLAAGCFSREVDARRVIKAGGVRVNHQRMDEPDHVLIAGQHILPNNCSLLRVGKKNYYLIKWRMSGV